MTYRLCPYTSPNALPRLARLAQRFHLLSFGSSRVPAVMPPKGETFVCGVCTVTLPRASFSKNQFNGPTKTCLTRAAAPLAIQAASLPCGRCGESLHRSFCSQEQLKVALVLALHALQLPLPPQALPAQPATAHVWSALRPCLRFASRDALKPARLALHAVAL